MAERVPDTDPVHLLLDANGLKDLSAFEAHYRKRGSGAPPFAPCFGIELDQNVLNEVSV